MPEAVSKECFHTTSMTITGDNKKGEGADFRLKEINRQIQHWLPNIPSTKDWKIACCNYDKLFSLRQTVFEQIGVTDPKMRSSASPPQNVSEEILAFRTLLRTKKYFTTPYVAKRHVSLDGQPLDEDLHTFCQQAREKRAQYIDAYLKYEETAEKYKPKAPTFRANPVYITKEERTKYTSMENKTIEAIKGMVVEDIQSITDEHLRDALTVTWLEISRAKKAALLDFYYELQEYVSQDSYDVQQEMDAQEND